MSEEKDGGGATGASGSAVDGAGGSVVDPAGRSGVDRAAVDETTPADGRRTELYDLRVVVDRIEGRSVCGLRPGDHVDLTCSSRITIPEGRHFCLYALSAILPLLPAAQRAVAAGDWLGTDEVACPDPEERLIMRIERTGRSSIPTEELT